MLYLIYGSDTTRSQQKLNEIIEEFRKKNGGDLAVYRFDAEEDELPPIKTALETNSLFQKKKLVVIQHALRADKLGGFKNIKFKELKDSSNTIVVLREWELDKTAIKRLAEIKPLCSKIQEFKTERHTEKDTRIFELGDVFFTSLQDALRRLHEILADGYDEFNIFSYLANHCRILLTIKAYSEMYQPIPASHGIHPFVIKKAAAAVRGFSIVQLRHMLQRFFEEDFRIKIGLSRPAESLFRILLQEKFRV